MLFKGMMIRACMFAGMGCIAVPVFAQSAQLVELAREDDAPDLEDDHGFGLDEDMPGRPWTLSAWAPVNWRSNRLFSSIDPTPALAVEPEISLARRFPVGPLTLFTEAGMFQSKVLPDASLDLSGWWGIAEISIGAPSEGFSPYIAYDSRATYAGSFGAHLLTFHDLTLGVRRNDGPWALNMFARRRESDGRAGDRWQFAAHGQYNVPLAQNLNLNIRGDAEYRTFDRLDGERRRDIRARLRGRMLVALDPAVDLALTADVARHWSTIDRMGFTNVTIGPALSARFGL